MLTNDPPLASVEDCAIPQCVPRGDDAIAIIRTFHNAWQRQQNERSPD
jgi:hypothetical protein